MWEDSDRDKAIAWQQIEDDRCPGCGNPLSETTQFELRTEWVAEDVSCHACRTKQVGASDYEPGVFRVVTRRDEDV